MSAAEPKPRRSAVPAFVALGLSLVLVLAALAVAAAEHEEASVLQAELEDARLELRQLEDLSRNRTTLDGEIANLRGQRDQLRFIVRGSIDDAKAAVQRSLERRGFRLASFSEQERLGWDDRPHQTVLVSLRIESDGPPWDEPLLWLDWMPTIFQSKRLEVANPQDPHSPLDLHLSFLVNP